MQGARLGNYSSFMQGADLVNTPAEDVLIEVQSATPPWKIDNITYCDELFGISMDNVAPRAFRRLYEEHKENHRYSLTIYTDGSKTGEGVAFAYKHQQEDAQKIQPHTSIFTGELYAIYYALNSAQQNPHPHLPITICTDSRGAIQAIVSLNNRNSLVQCVRNKIVTLNRQVCLCWVPSRVGVRSNEDVDKAAREATGRQQITEMGLPRSDITSYYKRLLTDQWRQRWEAFTGNKYREISGNIRPLHNATSRNRSWEVVQARLRLDLITMTHKYLMEGGHLPYCQDCVVPQTVIHALVECPAYSEE